jgi:hypothetical protein
VKTQRTLAISLAAAAASALPALPAAADTIHACVHQSTGDVRIVAPGTPCPRNHNPLEWNQPVSVPPPPQLHVQYMLAQGIGYARAFCPPLWKVTGGGGFAVDNSALAQSYPISTLDGVHAHGEEAIGWQVVRTPFEADPPFVQAYVVCARVF